MSRTHHILFSFYYSSLFLGSLSLHYFAQGLNLKLLLLPSSLTKALIHLVIVHSSPLYSSSLERSAYFSSFMLFCSPLKITFTDRSDVINFKVQYIFPSQWFVLILLAFMARSWVTYTNSWQITFLTQSCIFLYPPELRSAITINGFLLFLLQWCQYCHIT